MATAGVFPSHFAGREQFAVCMESLGCRRPLLRGEGLTDAQPRKCRFPAAIIAPSLLAALGDVWWVGMLVGWVVVLLVVGWPIVGSVRAET